jgi:uncharacterized protein YdaL
MTTRFFRILVLLVCFSVGHPARAEQTSPKTVLIVIQGSSSLKNYAVENARQLANLLGHFDTRVTIKGSDEYAAGDMKSFAFVFYIGFHARNPVPEVFLNDVLSIQKRIVWINSGLAEFSARFPVRSRFGFQVSRIDSTTGFDAVKSGSRLYTKGDPILNVIEIADRRQVRVLASALSSAKRRELPYIVTSGDLTYVADSPFTMALETDRYLLFADMLHDILGEDHPESHSALIRIEDVGVFDDPNRLREIADVLSEQGVPFLVSVIPFFVDPAKGYRLSLSDKPDLVDALKHMEQSGGTIVMHGSTHQYKGVTAADFEFWDESTNRPIKGESAEAFSRKLEMGIQEFMKNGLYPLAWETPHYTGSFLLYQTVSKYFSTAVEQRLSFEDTDFSQYFPYIIKRDLFGQTIYPENLGYVPLNPDRKTSEGYVQRIIEGARTNLSVRDGFASCFFHSFLDLDLLKELVTGVKELGYTYINIARQTNWVRTKDRVILSGSQPYTVEIQDQYLSELYFNDHIEPIRRIISEKRIRGSVTKEIELQSGEIYKAEPVEFREREVTFVEKVVARAKGVINNIFAPESDWREARVAILWNYYAKGAAYNDQASLASVFKSINLKIDTIFVGEPLELSPYNLVIIPVAFVDSLKLSDYGALLKYTREGGNIITDTRTVLAEQLGIHFSSTQIQIRSIRDRYFPEEEITWRYSEMVNRLDVDNVDEVFCQDASSDAPLVIGKPEGKGKVIFFGSWFDPQTQRGYGRYPYLLEYVKRYLRLGPIVRRDNLEAYFDPGYRTNYSIEDLVKLWVRAGIRRVHVSGWHEYAKYTYDYGRLIRLAHANGILVYAWLEPPQVTQIFWRNHPEWREKNYKGEDIQPAWRFTVALTEPACLDSIAWKYRKLLESFDWDGVNLAELYFESGKGFETPLLFTPMHPSAVREVKKRYGIELKSIFDPSSPWFWKTNPAVHSTLTEYRVEKLDEIYERLLREFSAVARDRPGFQIILTAMDSYGSPELREQLGVDMNHILALQKRYGFYLQIEDPEHLWSTDPRRYIQMGKQYEHLIGDRSKLLLDLNIVTVRKKGELTPFPTLIQTGTESFLLIQAATIGAPRFTFYSESSVNPQDIPYFAHAAAYDVTYNRQENRYSVEAPRSFAMKLPGETRQILLDGMLIPASRDNMFFIPAGNHSIDVNPGATGAFSTSQLQPRILSATSNISDLSYGMRNAKFAYESEERMLVSFSNEPTKVVVDGQQYSFSLMKGTDCYTILLPPGNHEVDVITGDAFAYGVNVTSLWSTTAIAIFGFLAVILLAALYLFVKLTRRRTHLPGKA